MPELLIREIPEPLLRALDARAADAGQSRAAWLRDQLARLAKTETAPGVRKRYRLVCSGPGAAAATIRRVADGERSYGGFSDCSDEQATAVRRARLLVEQNQLGDRERAIAELSAVFDEVLEGAA